MALFMECHQGIPVMKSPDDISSWASIYKRRTCHLNSLFTGQRGSDWESEVRW